ncbi:hypothetical protein ACWGPW_24575 [Paenibacillus chitinolyticus]
MIYRMCKDIGDFRPLNGSGTLNDQQMLWLYVMRSAEQIKEARYMCDTCRTDREIGNHKPHDCPSCGKKVNNFADPDREEKLKVYIEQQRKTKERKAKEAISDRKRIEAELEAEADGEEGEHGAGGAEG